MPEPSEHVSIPKEDLRARAFLATPTVGQAYISEPTWSSSERLIQELGWQEKVILLLVPTGYSFMFAVIGALIQIIQEEYGRRFTVYLAASFCMPGLVCAILQYSFDMNFDQEYSSRRTFQIRMCSYFVVLGAMALVLMLYRNEGTFLFCMTLVGFSTWLAHGTFSQLALLLHSGGILWQQMGFQQGVVLGLLLLLSMNIKSGMKMRDDSITLYFGISFGVVMLALLVWLLGSDRFMARLDLRDVRLAKEESEESERLLTVAEADQTEATKNFRHELLLLSVAMFLNITISNVMGCLFAYIDSDGTMNVVTVLFFTRLILDAFSRVIAHFWQPWFVTNSFSILISTIVRVSLSSIFFLYQSGVLGKSDVFIAIYVGVTSFFSGFIGTFVYAASREIALQLVTDKQEAGLAQSSLMVNMSFNAAGFVSAPLSIAISYLLD